MGWVLFEDEEEEKEGRRMEFSRYSCVESTQPPPRPHRPSPHTSPFVARATRRPVRIGLQLHPSNGSWNRSADLGRRPLPLHIPPAADADADVVQLPIASPINGSSRRGFLPPPTSPRSPARPPATVLFLLGRSIKKAVGLRESQPTVPAHPLASPGRPRQKLI